MTGYWTVSDNPVAKRFYGLTPLEQACSMFFYLKDGSHARLIHQFKFHGQWQHALRLGTWFGTLLRDGGLYDDVDVVMPVPLHWRRKLSRGYNQSAYLAQGIAQELGKPVDRYALRRSVYNRPQTRIETKHDRWDNVSGIFVVRKPQRLAGKHILLVDDVLTTGATLLSCIESLHRSIPDCRVSLVTLSVSAYELFGRHRGGL